MKAASALLSALLILSFADSTLAQGERNPEIIIDGVSVSLGMPEQTVLSKLGSEHRVEKVSGDVRADMWLVMSKQGPPSVSYGSVSFEDGKLSQASVDWANSADRGALGFARAVLGALSSAAGQFGTTCTVTVRRAQTPGSDYNFASVKCGRRTVGISLLMSLDGKIVSSALVSEEIDSVGGSAPE